MKLSEKMRAAGWLMGRTNSIVSVKDPILGTIYNYDNSTHKWDRDPTMMVEIHLAIKGLDWGHEYSDCNATYRAGDIAVGKIRCRASLNQIDFDDLRKIEAKYSPFKGRHSYFIQ